jgi:putative ABC transport system permease protein
MEIRPILSTLRRHKVTAFLLVLEIAFTCAIICNAVFLIGQRLERMDMPSGIAEHELIQIQMAPIGSGGDTKARAAEDLALLRQIPGVKEVALVNEIPFGKSSWNGGVKLSADQKQASANVTRYFGENLLETFGTQLVAGRSLNSGDMVDFGDVLGADSNSNVKIKTAVITSALAATLWPGENPLGKAIYDDKDPVTIVGVVKTLVRPSVMQDNIAQYSLIYPGRMTVTMGASYVLRTAPADRERVMKAAIAGLKAVDPNRIVNKQRTWDEIRDDFFRDDRSMAGLLAGVCVALLVVTALGIVGLGSFWVSQRRRQIGVRRALGATRANILHYFQTENFVLATIGIAIGMILAYGINLFLMTQYELPRLPFIYFPVGAVLLWLLGQAAVLGPALRAAAVPPVVATRGG